MLPAPAATIKLRAFYDQSVGEFRKIADRLPGSRRTILQLLRCWKKKPSTEKPTAVNAAEHSLALSNNRTKAESRFLEVITAQATALSGRAYCGSDFWAPYGGIVCSADSRLWAAGFDAASLTAVKMESRAPVLRRANNFQLAFFFMAGPPASESFRPLCQLLFRIHAPRQFFAPQTHSGRIIQIAVVPVVVVGKFLRQPQCRAPQ